MAKGNLVSKTKRIVRALGICGGVVAVGGLIGGCDPVQPKTICKARGEEYAARYFVQNMSGACDGKILTGEVLHLGYFRDGKDYAQGAPSVAIEPESIAEAVYHSMSHSGTEYALGKYVSYLPDDNDVCSAPDLGEHSVKADDRTLSYKWKDFQIVVRPTSNAFHFGAEMTRKDGDCTATYKVSASAPAVHCGDGKKPKLDEQGKPTGEMEDDPTTGKPDPSRCDSDPLKGSGLSPDLAWECDANAAGEGSHLCVPKYQFPALGRK